MKIIIKYSTYLVVLRYNTSNINTCMCIEIGGQKGGLNGYHFQKLGKIDVGWETKDSYISSFKTQ